VGGANVDFCMDLPTLPAPGETVPTETYRRTFGGKGANAAVAAALAGGRVSFVGCVGRDVFGEEIGAQLRSKGIDTTHLEYHPTVPTGAAFIFVDNRGQNIIGVALGANNQLTPARIDALRSVIREAAILLVQNEIPEETVTRLLTLAKEEPVRVLYNCAPARKVPLSLLATVEWLVLNESEAAFISGLPVANREEAEIAVRRLLGDGIRNVLITLGAGGVCAGNAGEIFHVPAYSVQAVDTVAAGDIFCGALAVACSEGQPLPAAIRFASAAAAISVTRSGAQTSAPTRAEIDRLFQAGH